MDTSSLDTRIVNRVLRLHPREIPEHLMREDAARLETDFDPNTYFSVLTHISMKPGYGLDYIYHWGDFGGGPELIIRSASGQRVELPSQSIDEDDDEDEDEEEDDEDRPEVYNLDLLPFLETDGSPDGFFQLVVFLRAAGQFYLYWHALYNDLQMLTKPADIERIIARTTREGRLDDDQIAAFRAFAAEPSVVFGEDRVTVTYSTFSNWEGLQRYEDCFRRQRPHLLLHRRLLDEVSYHCGIWF